MIKISPSYKMDLIERLNETLYEKYNSYRNVELYIRQWQTEYNNFGELNFEIKYRGDGYIDLRRTLHEIFSDELLLKIAVDLDVDTPNFIPAVPLIKNVLKLVFYYFIVVNVTNNE